MTPLIIGGPEVIAEAADRFASLGVKLGFARLGDWGLLSVGMKIVCFTTAV